MDIQHAYLGYMCKLKMLLQNFATAPSHMHSDPECFELSLQLTRLLAEYSPFLSLMLPLHEPPTVAKNHHINASIHSLASG